MSEETVMKADVKKKEGLNKWAMALISAGVLMLVVNLLGINLMEFLWPAFIVGPGLLMLWPSYQSTSESQSGLSFLAVPGAITVAVGLLLFLMNIVNHFESWAYVWPLVVAAGAAGYDYMHRFKESTTRAEKVHNFIRTMVITFMVLAVFFELLIFKSLGSWWPLLLIGLGFYVYVKNRRHIANEQS